MLATILTIATVVLGVLYALDRFYWRPKNRTNFLGNLGREFFVLVAAVFVLRSFLFEPFRIPSGSMIPTLLVGDFILVNKFAYGLKTPIGNHTMLDTGHPSRGDVVVFQYPKDTREDYIKRLVGLPGDRVEYRDKTLYVNGEKARRTFVGEYVVDNGLGQALVVERWHESFLGVEHDILVNPQAPARDFALTVPPGEYWMMGDNRDGSADSRYWGTVPEHNLRGRAVAIWLTLSGDYGRMFTRVR